VEVSKMLHFGCKMIEFWCQNSCISAFKMAAFWQQNGHILAFLAFWQIGKKTILACRYIYHS
jgi:hypothetical protein